MSVAEIQPISTVPDIEPVVDPNQEVITSAEQTSPDIEQSNIPDTQGHTEQSNAASEESQPDVEHSVDPNQAVVLIPPTPEETDPQQDRRSYHQPPAEDGIHRRARRRLRRSRSRSLFRSRSRRSLSRRRR